MNLSKNLAKIFAVSILNLLLIIPSIYAQEPIVSEAASKKTISLMECYDLALKRSETVAISKEEIERAEATFFRATGEALGDVDFIATSTRQDARDESSQESGSSVGSTFSARE